MKRKDIVGTAATGLGCLTEGEVVVKPGAGKAYMSLSGGRGNLIPKDETLLEAMYNDLDQH